MSDEMQAVFAAIDKAEAQYHAADSFITRTIDAHQAAQEELNGILVRRPSDDESVIAGVDARHRLRDLWIKEGACTSHTNESLAREIHSAIKAASAEADTRRGNIAIAVDASAVQELMAQQP